MRVIVVTALLLLLPGSIYGARDAEQKAEQLEELRARIAQIQSELKISESQLENLYRQLRQDELLISDTTRELRGLDQAITAKAGTLARLNQRKRTQFDKLERRKGNLKSQISSVYLLSQQDIIKLLLNQEDPSRISRALGYHAYFVKAYTQQISETKETLAAIQTLVQTIQRDSKQLKRLKENRQQELKKLTAYKEDRDRLSSKLEKQVRDQDKELSQLREDEKRLDKLVDLLQANIPPAVASDDLDRPFSALRGKLPWPVNGLIVQSFGASLDHGALISKGVVLEASPGSDVTAVSHGRVIFADWFINLGMLIIIDHGDGYMTLYAHNQALHKEAGDEATPGEIIATTGDKEGLYFEVRHNGTPKDPAGWCQRQAAGEGV